VEADNAGGPALLEPGDQFVAAAYAQPTEIENAEFRTAPLPQACDTFQCLHVIVEGRSDKDANLKIASLSLLPVVKPMHQLLETGKRQGAALARFRDQAIAADMGAGRMTQRKSQPFPNDLPRHCYPVLGYPVLETTGATSSMKHSIDLSSWPRSRLPWKLIWKLSRAASVR
jgi:hypothetical protein